MPGSARRTIGLLVATILAAAVVASVAGVRTDGGGPPLKKPLAARPASDFLDAVGVNVHASYADTAYARFDAWRVRLEQLGVRHVRDSIVFGDPAFVARHRALAQRGVRSSFAAVDRTRSPAELVRLVAGPLRPAAEAFEGPNEPDVRWGPRWAGVTQHFVERLHAEVVSSGLDIPSAGQSFANEAARSRIAGAGRLWQDENLHAYPAARTPEELLPHAVAAARVRAPGEPVVVTEMGYQDAGAASSGQPAVTEAAAADYVPRAFLEAFAAGAQRAYLYELADERPDAAGSDPEQHFGLLRTDLTPKPAFESLRRLVSAIRSSPGPGERRPVELDAAGDVRSLLLDRPDGSRALVLWRRIAHGHGGTKPARVRFQGHPDRAGGRLVPVATAS